MNVFGTVLAICCLQVAKAVPGQWASFPMAQQSSGSSQLEGTPDLETYSKITFPKYELLDLGEYSKGQLPADEIKITKESKISYPQPYPIKVPIPQPYPVHVDKPYPVHETKIVKVPVPYPQIVEKKVPYPVEVPKPYPVQVSSHDEGNQIGGGGGGGFDQAPPHGGDIGGGSFGGHQALEGNGYSVQEQHDLPSNEGIEHGFGGGNFNPYESKAVEEGYDAPSGGDNGGWQPIGGGEEAPYH